MTLKERGRRCHDARSQGAAGLEDGDDELRDKRRRAFEPGGVNIVVNLKDVTYIDSCGIGVLIAKYVSLRDKGGDVRAPAPAPRAAIT